MDEKKEKKDEKKELFAWEECMKKKFIFAREHKKSLMPEEIIRLTAEKVVGTLEKRRVYEEDKISSLHQKMENIEQQVARLAQAFEDKGLTPRNTSCLQGHVHQDSNVRE